LLGSDAIKINELILKCLKIILGLNGWSILKNECMKKFIILLSNGKN